MATVEKYETRAGATFYRVHFRTPDDNRSTQKRGFKTKREAQQWANKVEVKKMTGEYVSPSVGKVTIGTLGPEWLDRQRGHLKASTIRNYEVSWSTHVTQRWGAVPISNIHYSDVQAWVSGMSARRGPGAVRIAYSVLARILDDAVRDRLLSSNPARGVKLPKLPPQHNTYLTAVQLQRLADESGRRYKSLVLVLGVGGLRLGETAALRVSDVDFLRRRVELRRNAVKVGTEFVVGSLKSHKNRTVVLPAFVVAEVARVCEGKGRDDLIWPSPRGGFISGPSLWKTSWLAMAVGRCQKAADEARAEESRKGGQPTTPVFPRVTPA